ncbi:MAG: phospho-N-acetylmuramoyl-pentapeptide-transferase [Clostridia bacterium]|nr:phospho-N-acetylmuramoyl-pentapeptide-transferase [Clostridia bacterium]
MEFLQKISNLFGGINIQTKALIISFIGTVILGFIIIPILKKLKIGQVVRDDGPQSHLKKSGTPTMGGIIMLIVSVAVSFLISLKYPDILPVALVTLGYGLVGFIDDFIKLVLKNPKGLKPSLKMLGLIIVSVIFVVYLTRINFGTDTYIPIMKTYIILPVWFYIPAMVFIMLACTNSLNLTDGLDGLAAGVNGIIMIFFTFIAMAWGDKEMSTFSAIMTGTSVGFLLFNLYPAKVFMGDTGSLALGGAFCSVAIMLKMPLILIVVAGICVIEALSVILQVGYFKATNGKRLFKMAPFHHHLELCGVKETVIVPAFWLVTIVLCVLGAFII